MMRKLKLLYLGMLLAGLVFSSCQRKHSHTPWSPNRLAAEELGPPNVDLPPEQIRFEDEIARFLEDDSLHPDRENPIIFTGSSSIRKWKTLEEDMAPLPALNRGFGGSTIPLVNYFAHQFLLPHQPKIIVLYAGENDIAWDESKGTTPYYTFRKFERLIHFHLPETRILYISMKPSPSRWKYWDKFQQGNEMIRVYCESEPLLEYIDVGPIMTDENCEVREDIFIRDRLHMNEAGYALWTELIKPRVAAHWEEIEVQQQN